MHNFHTDQLHIESEFVSAWWLESNGGVSGRCGRSFPEDCNCFITVFVFAGEKEKEEMRFSFIVKVSHTVATSNDVCKLSSPDLATDCCSDSQDHPGRVTSTR